MRKDKCVYRLSVRKTGNQQPKLIKVIIIHQIFYADILIIILHIVIQALVALVNEPEPEHPLRADLAEEYLKDKKKFTKNAEEYTKKHSERRPAD